MYGLITSVVFLHTPGGPDREAGVYDGAVRALWSSYPGQVPATAAGT